MTFTSSTHFFFLFLPLSFHPLLCLHLLCDISIHDFLASLMLQLFLGCLTQTVVDHAVHIAGTALIQFPFGNFSITVVTADFQLIHAVRMLGEQSLKLVNQNPGSRLPDVLVHSRGKQNRSSSNRGHSNEPSHEPSRLPGCSTAHPRSDCSGCP